MAKSKQVKRQEALARAEEYGRDLEKRIEQAEQDLRRNQRTEASKFEVTRLGNGTRRPLVGGAEAKVAVIYSNQSLLSRLREDVRRNNAHMAHLRSLVGAGS